MSTKLKNLKITKVDVVDQGANQDADIVLTKRDDNDNDNPGEKKFLKRLIDLLAKATKEAETFDNSIKEIGKSESFNEKLTQRSLDHISNEIWDSCYALESSLCSILFDEEIGAEEKNTAMLESLHQFTTAMEGFIPSWSNQQSSNVVRKVNNITEEQLDVMKSAKDRLEEAIEKAVVIPASGEGQSDAQNMSNEGGIEMIDKSKLTPGERAFLEEIEKRYSTDVAKSEGTPAPAEPAAPVAEPTPAPVVTPVATPAPAPAPAEPVVEKGIHPAVAAELEALRKMRESMEDAELRKVAKSYEIIGKKEEELFPLLKSVKAAGGTAYDDMIAVLEQSKSICEKSFTEVGKSNHGTVGYTSGEAWSQAEAKASEIMKSKGVSKAQALDEVFSADPELAKKCEEEE